MLLEGKIGFHFAFSAVPDFCSDRKQAESYISSGNDDSMSCSQATFEGSDPSARGLSDMLSGVWALLQSTNPSVHPDADFKPQKLRASHGSFPFGDVD